MIPNHELRVEGTRECGAMLRGGETAANLPHLRKLPEHSRSSSLGIQETLMFWNWDRSRLAKTRHVTWQACAINSYGSYSAHSDFWVPSHASHHYMLVLPSWPSVCFPSPSEVGLHSFAITPLPFSRLSGCFSPSLAC